MITEQVRALFAYVAKIEDELSFPKGAIIMVKDTHSADDGWWQGDYNGKTGVFPANYVEALTSSSSSSDPSPLPRPSSSVIAPGTVLPASGYKPAPPGGELGEPLLEKDSRQTNSKDQRLCGGYVPADCTIL
jgi:hypothetical protein